MGNLNQNNNNYIKLINPVPLPVQQAIDFQLPAVVGDDIKNIKLSDYDGKWRVLCFFPAAFTFV
jgi:peroxiredoxin (alkyl hydroperoxide reductase subunit C)